MFCKPSSDKMITEYELSTQGQSLLTSNSPLWCEVGETAVCASQIILLVDLNEATPYNQVFSHNSFPC